MNTIIITLHFRPIINSRYNIKRGLISKNSNNRGSIPWMRTNIYEICNVYMSNITPICLICLTKCNEVIGIWISKKLTSNISFCLSCSICRNCIFPSIRNRNGSSLNWSPSSTTSCNNDSIIIHKICNRLTLFTFFLSHTNTSNYISISNLFLFHRFDTICYDITRCKIKEWTRQFWIVFFFI